MLLKDWFSKWFSKPLSLEDLSASISLCARSQVFTAPGKEICSSVMSSPKLHYFIYELSLISRSHLMQNLQLSLLAVYLHSAWKPSEGQKHLSEVVFSI